MTPWRLLGACLWPWSLGLSRALADPVRAQERVRRRIHADLCRTALGAHDHLTPDGGPLDGVPVRAWSELAPFVALHRQRQHGITTSPIRLWEPTSGSSGLRKDIPWSAELQHAVTSMFLIWLGDLLRNGPAHRGARSWIATTPRLAPVADAPSAAADDTDYLSPWLRPVLRRFLVPTPRFDGPVDGLSFIDALARQLLDESRLEVMSLWSPSLLRVLLDHIAARRDTLAAALSGSRRDALLTDPIAWGGVWPDLRLISCWRDASAAADASHLDRALPGVFIQGKGLLATEGPMTVPLFAAPAPVPLVQAVLIELLDDAGALLPLHRAEEGRTYEIVPSWPGGLVRYRIGDRVRAEGRMGATPCLRFVGRTGTVSDLVGEKLHGDVVAVALDDHLRGRWALLVPVSQPRRGYCLITEGVIDAAVVDAIDLSLCVAWHYGQARALGQLAPLRLVAHPQARSRAWTWRAAEGSARLGDVKEVALLLSPADDLVRGLEGPDHL